MTIRPEINKGSEKSTDTHNLDQVLVSHPTATFFSSALTMGRSSVKVDASRLGSSVKTEDFGRKSAADEPARQVVNLEDRLEVVSIW